MLAKSRKDYNGVIILHKPVPPHLLHHTSLRSIGEKSSSVMELPYVRCMTQKPTRVVTGPRTGGHMAHTHSPCSVKQLQDQFVSERRETEAITQPLLDTENCFVKDVGRFLNHRDMLSVRKRELLYKRWTECVWWPIQHSIKQHFIQHHYKVVEPMKMMHSDCAKVLTSRLKDPLFLHFRSRMKENSVVLHCMTGCLDDGQWAASSEEQRRNKRDLHRSPGPVYMAVADGRCYRPECWSATGLSRGYLKL